MDSLRQTHRQAGTAGAQLRSFAVADNPTGSASADFTRPHVPLVRLDTPAFFANLSLDNIAYTVSDYPAITGDVPMLALPNVEYPTSAPWNGKILGGYVRNSTWVQRDNARADFQLIDMGQYAKERGYAVRWFDERGVSGSRMTKRIKLQTLLGLIAQGHVHGIFCADVARLSRDERLLDPMLIADTLRNHAEGRLLTHGRELDLRRPDDWKLFTVLALVASWQRGDTLVAASQGYKVAVQRVFQGDREMFRKGKVMIGYKRVPVLDQDGQPRHNSNGRIVTTYEKNLTDEPALTALAEEFDRQITFTAVVGALLRRRVVGPAHATDGYTWTSRLLREILKDRLYEGIWTASDTPTPVRRLLEADGIQIGTNEYPVPHLAWWPSWRMDRWRAKFLANDSAARFRTRTIPHPLLGLAICAGCGALLGAFGAKFDGYEHRVTYRCPNRKRGCPTQTLLTEGPMLRAMAKQLPDILERTADVTSAIWAKLAIGSDGGTDAQITALDQREIFLRDNYVRRMKVPPDWLLAEMQEIAEAKQRKLQERAAIAAQRDLAQIAAEVLAMLRSGRIRDLETQTPERQAAVWRHLISEARFTVGGTSGKGRTVSVELTPITTPKDGYGASSNHVG
jgi:hypothetical protein